MARNPARAQLEENIFDRLVAFDARGAQISTS
jgi:hypothetical protein